MQTFHESRWKVENRYFGRFRVQFNLRYIKVLGELICWLVSLILISIETLMIGSIHKSMFSLLVPYLLRPCKKQSALDISLAEVE